MRIVKRIALGLLIVLALAVVTLFALGQKADANRVLASIVINQPPAQAWPWIIEPQRQKQWVSWLVESTANADGTFHWAMRDPNMDNMIVRIDGQRTTYDPPRTLASHIQSKDMFEGDITYTLADLGGGQTRLTYEMRFKYYNWFARLLGPLVRPEARKKLEDDLARLKQLAESNVVPANATLLWQP